MNVVDERFQITIDEQIREQLGIRAGDRASQSIENGRLVVTFRPIRHSRSLLGALRTPGVEPIEDWQEVKDRAWSARAAEIR